MRVNFLVLVKSKEACFHYDTISNYLSTLQILSEGHLMLALFSFVRANESQSGPREWTPAQFEELQLQAMSCLCALCPKMLDDYMTVQGSTRILLLLEWCVGAGMYTVFSYFY